MRLNAQAVYQLMIRNLITSLRTPMLIVAGIVQPVIWMAIFSQGLSRVADFSQFRHIGYTSYLMFLTPGVMALTVLNTSVRSGIAMVTDINNGVLDKFLISPINRATILLGRTFADAITMFLQCLIVLGIGYALGITVRAGIAGVVAMLVLSSLLGICAAAFSDFVALRTRNPQVTMLIGINIALPLLFLSPAFFPQPLQPKWIVTVAQFNPVTYVVRTGQGLIIFGFSWPRLLFALGVLTVAGMLSLAAATSAFRRMTSPAEGAGSPGPIGRLARKLLLFWVKRKMARAGVGPGMPPMALPETPVVLQKPAAPGGAKPDRDQAAASL